MTSMIPPTPRSNPSTVVDEVSPIDDPLGGALPHLPPDELADDALPQSALMLYAQLQTLVPLPLGHGAKATRDAQSPQAERGPVHKQALPSISRQGEARPAMAGTLPTPLAAQPLTGALGAQPTPVAAALSGLAVVPGGVAAAVVVDAGPIAGAAGDAGDTAAPMAGDRTAVQGAKPEAPGMAASLSSAVQKEPRETLPERARERLVTSFAGEPRPLPATAPIAPEPVPPRPVFARPQPAPLPPGRDGAVNGSYLQVPFDNGSVAGQITITKADANMALPLQLTTSNADLDGHLREQLAHTERPWHLARQQDQGGRQQSAHGDDQDADAETPLPVRKREERPA